MEVIIFCIAWYVVGVIGCILGTLSDLIDGVDFKVNDLIMNAFVALFGPITFMLGLIAYVSNTKSGKFNKTLIKGKK